VQEGLEEVLGLAQGLALDGPQALVSTYKIGEVAPQGGGWRSEGKRPNVCRRDMRYRGLGRPAIIMDPVLRTTG